MSSQFPKPHKHAHFAHIAVFGGFSLRVGDNTDQSSADISVTQQAI